MAMLAGAQGHLVKPVAGCDELYNTIHQVYKAGPTQVADAKPGIQSEKQLRISELLGERKKNNRTIRVLIVDDIAETRDHLRKLFSFYPDIEVVGTARDGREGIELAKQYDPHIVLMDINMSGMDGITATRKLREEVPEALVIMLSVQGETDYLRRAMLAGARDFLTKPASGDELVSSIHRNYQMGQERPAKVMPHIQSLEELQILEILSVYEENFVLGRALDALETTTSGIPHDLKEPLGVASNILGGLSTVSPPMAECVAYCKAKIDYALLLVNRLISTTSCGEIEVQTETFFSEVLDRVLCILNCGLRAAQTFDLHLESEDFSVQFKESDLEQIIACLLENAIEATPQGEALSMTVKSKSNDCCIKIQGAGKGLEELAELNNTSGHTTRQSLVSLGLFVCRRIVAQYGGEFLFEPSADKRTMRSVIFPKIFQKDRERYEVRVVLPKKFQNRKVRCEIEDIKQTLQKYRNKPLISQQRDTIDRLVKQILIAFVNRLSSTIDDVVLRLSSMFNQISFDSDRDLESALRAVLRNCAYARSVSRSLIEPSQPTQVQPVHLKPALLSTLSLFASKLPSGSVKFEVNENIWLKADQTQFQRVFFNLTRNALEAMQTSSKFTIGVKADTRKDYAVIQFADTGVGIPSEIIGQVFERGFSTKEEGRGMGLFVTKSVVEQHQGQIEVMSREGLGTCFEIHWPLAVQPADEVSLSPISEILTEKGLFQSSKVTNGGKTQLAAVRQSQAQAQILIVEDDSVWLDHLTRGLQSSHYEIHKTRKAGEALELIRDIAYDLVLLDWRMPGKVGGRGILRIAQGVNPDMPIIILSAFGNAEQRTSALQLGARAFIDKPRTKSQWDELKRRVAETIGRGE